MSSETSDNLTGTSLEATIVEQGRKAGLMKNKLRKKRLHKAWKKQREHRQRKAKQLRDVHAANIRSDEPTIDLNVGGIYYLTSLSTLTSSPDSYFGVMFSGRHDLKAMQCKDGSYFIDRDGTHFRFILNYLRNGEEMVESISRLSTDVALDLLCEAKFYQLDGLIKVLQREIDVITQDRFIIMCHAEDVYGTWYCSKEIVFKNKNMTELSLVEIKFKEAVSFINCNLSNSIFRDCEFRSDVIFKNCLLVNTMFIGLRVNSKDSESSTDSESLRSEHTETYNISFIDSNIERASFLRCTKYQWH